MRASLVGTAIVSCVFAVSVAAAQDKPAAPAGQKEHTMTGCLQKTADKRYASALELADDLRRWLDGDSIKARPVTRWEKT